VGTRRGARVWAGVKATLADPSKGVTLSPLLVKVRRCVREDACREPYARSPPVIGVWGGVLLAVPAAAAYTWVGG
jgi:hypothetical protein